MSRVTGKDKKGNTSQLTSNTVAPPADAPSLDLQHNSGAITIRPSRQDKSSLPKGSSSGHYSSSRSHSTAHHLDPTSTPHQYASSSRHGPSHQPSSGTQRIAMPSVRGTEPPPAYKTTVGTSQRGAPTAGAMLDRRTNSNLIASRLDGKSRAAAASSSQHGGHSSHHASSGGSRTERSPFPDDKKMPPPSSSSRLQSQSIRNPPSHAQTDRHGSHASSTSRAGSSSHYTSQHGATAGPSARVRTENYKVGDMNRTFLEGMVPATANAHYAGPSSSQAQNTIVKNSSGLSKVKSILKNEGDFAMAKRQTQYTSLNPSERKEQEAWAQSMIQRSGSCPEGFKWERIHDGYQCGGGHHIISDELLAEGRGGVFALLDWQNLNDRLGPYYTSVEDPHKFVYRGVQPKPECAPSYFIATSKITTPGGSGKGAAPTGSYAAWSM